MDQWTSRQPVSKAARDVAKLIELILANKVSAGLAGDPGARVVHVAGDRKSIFDYAQSLGAQDVGTLERREVAVQWSGLMLPEDCSLDCSKFKDILWRQREEWIGQEGAESIFQETENFFQEESS